ncbi:ABC transporter permease [Raoultibacter massiliensis]|uniref:ABC transporter permease n=1 Tax=Raoultibacter massiliensis TaxID=1852371 RepID=UPI000C81E464|nr:ABC transporter permease [Raoultibacter massiliensis]
MIDYLLTYPDKLLTPLLQHLELLVITLVLSLAVATVLTIASMYSKALARFLTYLFSIIYSIPSLALFVLLIPLTGLGATTALIVLVTYNQYLLLRNFLAGLEGVDPAVIEAATGMGMSTMQILVKIRLPLAKKVLFTGIRLSAVSTIGIITIAALINAGGIGTLLFDGLRTMNTVKILWGAILAGGLAIAADALLKLVEKRLGGWGQTHPATLKEPSIKETP